MKPLFSTSGPTYILAILLIGLGIIGLKLLSIMAPLGRIILLSFVLGGLGIIGLILSLPFIIYGAIKHKKNFIILGIIGLLMMPITRVLLTLAIMNPLSQQ